jgi:3-oxoacyl-(acyl-carrier-protein) synthase
VENQNNVVITQNNVADTFSKLVEKRHALVKSAKEGGIKISDYANMMCTAFNQVDSSGTVITPWYEHKGKARAGVKLEHEAFKTEMGNAGFDRGTIDVYWQRVKIASGYQTSGMRAKGNQSVDDMNQRDLKTIINRIFKAEEEGKECEFSSQVKGLLMDAFEGLGGDVSTLG